MADNAHFDNNHVPTLLAVSSVDGVSPVTVYADPATHRLLTTPTAGASGSFTSQDGKTVTVVNGLITTIV